MKSLHFFDFTLLLTLLLITTPVHSLVVGGEYLYAGTDGGVFRSSDNGAAWKALSTGLTNSAVVAFALKGTDLFAGTYGGGVFRQPIHGTITAISSPSRRAPAAFRLDQNYPNPWNPAATIRYELKQRTHVILTVYDILGRQVMRLVDGKETAGVHTVRMFSGNLASGVYYYRLQGGPFAETKKMLVIR